MVEYEFYNATYMGSAIPAEEWPALSRRAEEQLGKYKRLYTVTAPEETSEAMAICAMAESIHNVQLIANGQGGAVQSASVGSVSVSYGAEAVKAVDVSPAGQAQALFAAAQLYLEFYRGCS